MKKTTPKAKKNFKRALIIGLSVLTVFSASTAAICAVSANNVCFVEDDIKQVDYNMNLRKENTLNLDIPIRTQAVVKVNAEEEGYYRMAATKNEITGEYVTFTVKDDNSSLAAFSYWYEDETAIIMPLHQGENKFNVSNLSYCDSIVTTFTVTKVDEFINPADADSVPQLELTDEMQVKAGETGIFKIRNTEDDYMNVISAKGENLSLQLLDVNFTSCGYDNSDMNTKGEATWFVKMRAEGTPYYFAVVTNGSDEDVTVKYMTEIAKDAEGIEEIKLNTPTQLNAEHSLVTPFKVEKTGEYDFCFTGNEGTELNFIVSDMADYDKLAEGSFVLGGSAVLVEGVELEEGREYAIIIRDNVSAKDNLMLTIK